MPCRNVPRPTAEPYYGMSVFTFAFNAFVMPQLVQHKVCNNKYNSSICSNLGKGKLGRLENQVQEEAATWMALLPLSALLPGFFMILIIGPLSDVIGKKRLMTLPPFIYLIQSLVLIILCWLKRPFSPAYFFIPICLTGIFGDNAGCAMLSSAYIADITKSEDRTLRLTLLESAIFIATLASALGSGAIISEFGFIGGFVATAIVNFLNLLYAVFVIPSESTLRPPCHSESARYPDYGTSLGHQGAEVSDNARNEQETGDWKRMLRKALNLQDVFARFKNALCTNEKTQKIIAVLLVLLAIGLITAMGEVYMGILFLKHSPFNMKAIDIGYYAAATYTLRAAGVITIPYVAQRVFKVRDTGLVIFGFASQTIFFMLLGFAVNILMLYLLQIIGLAVPMHLPVLRSMISKLVKDDQHGTAIAAAEAIDIASSLTTSFLSNIIYSATVRLFSGFAMCILGMFAFVGLIGAIVFRCSFKQFHQDDFSILPDEEQTVLLHDEKEIEADSREHQE